MPPLLVLLRLPRDALVVLRAELRLGVVLRLLVPAPDLAELDLRVVELLFDLPPAVFAAERVVEPLLLRAVVERLLVERALVLVLFVRLLLAPLLLARLLRAELERPLLAPLVAPSSGHLPDITRCAASATASAIRAPSLVALDTTELAALLAVSAASMPASLIALRALGLALIAAAAAARPAASISLLIAALPILSRVVSFDLDELEEPRFEDLDELLRLLDFAIANLPCRPNRHLRRTTVPLRRRKGAGFRRITGS